MAVLESIVKSFWKPKTQVRGCDFTLVVGLCNTGYGQERKETESLARRIASYGADVLTTKISWPRDELLFFGDGTFVYAQKATIQEDLYPHQAFHQGKILEGEGFILCSSTIPEEKREETQRALGAEKAFYFDIKKCMRQMSGIRVSGNKSFYSDKGHVHIDILFNLANRAKVIFTYEHPLLAGIAEKMAESSGYSIARLPISEASVASVGFVELGDHAVVDKRAKATIEILQSSGYNVIPTPRPMKYTNQNGGTVRCRCTELPIKADRIKFYPFKGDGRWEVDTATHIEAFSSILWNFDGYKAVIPHFEFPQHLVLEY